MQYRCLRIPALRCVRLLKWAYQVSLISFCTSEYANDKRIASNTSLHTAIQNSLGIAPSLACLINLYYFSIALKPQASAMHVSRRTFPQRGTLLALVCFDSGSYTFSVFMQNLALLHAQIDRNYPARRLAGPENKTTYQIPMEYACLWMHEASQARPRGTVSGKSRH